MNHSTKMKYPIHPPISWHLERLRILSERHATLSQGLRQAVEDARKQLKEIDNAKEVQK